MGSTLTSISLTGFDNYSANKKRILGLGELLTGIRGKYDNWNLYYWVLGVVILELLTDFIILEEWPFKIFCIFVLIFRIFKASKLGVSIGTEV